MNNHLDDMFSRALENLYTPPRRTGAIQTSNKMYVVEFPNSMFATIKRVDITNAPAGAFDDFYAAEGYVNQSLSNSKRLLFTQTASFYVDMSTVICMLSLDGSDDSTFDASSLVASVSSFANSDDRLSDNFNGYSVEQVSINILDEIFDGITKHVSKMGFSLESSGKVFSKTNSILKKMLFKPPVLTIKKKKIESEIQMIIDTYDIKDMVTRLTWDMCNKHASKGFMNFKKPSVTKKTIGSIVEFLEQYNEFNIEELVIFNELYKGYCFNIPYMIERFGDSLDSDLKEHITELPKRVAFDNFVDLLVHGQSMRMLGNDSLYDHGLITFDSISKIQDACRVAIKKYMNLK